MRLYSLDELLEMGLANIYRAWYALPRRSTLPYVNRLRGELANRLQAFVRPIDLTVYEQALIDFARALRALPGVAEVGGAPLAQAAEAVPLTQRQSYALLDPTNATAARVEELAALLRCENPPQAIIARMSYAPAEAHDTWHAIWSVLEPRLPEFPAPDRARLEAIHAAWVAELAAAQTPLQRQDAYLRALSALEQEPAAIRVGGQVLAARKYAGDAPRPLNVAKDLIDLPLGAPWPSESVASAVTGSASAEKPTVSFFTNVRFPERIQRNQVQWLTVQLTLDAAADSVIEKRVPIQFKRTKADQLPPPEIVEVQLIAADFNEETGVWSRTMSVYPQRDSQPVVFLLRSDKVGPKQLNVDFLHKGRIIASLQFKCQVVDGSMAAPSQKVEFDEQPEIGPFAENPPPPADIVLRVARTGEGSGLAFMLNSAIPDLPYHAQPMGQIKLTEKDPQSFFTARLQRMSELAAAMPDSATDGRMVQEIEALGEGLFELLIPPELQAAYWQQIKPLADAGKISTFLILSDEPWIPWELIKPYLWNDASNTEQTADFWVEQFALSRWLARPQPPGLTVKGATLVVPDINLTSTQEETSFVVELMREHHINLAGPLDERDAVIDSLREGNFQLLHFATHGSFDPTNADRAELTLVDGSLTPADLMGGDLSGLRMRRPLIFLNACHSGQVTLSLTGLGGWADKFFREARASAFVGTLWEVSDALAADFARVFYTELAAGKSLGVALRTARLHVRNQAPANPTWLAYALYGDPNGKVKFG